MGHVTHKYFHEYLSKPRLVPRLNLNKLEKAHLDIINEKVSTNYDIMLIQEPYTTTFNAIQLPTNFRPIFSINRLQIEEQIWSVI